MKKHHISIEADSLGHLRTADLRIQLEEKLRSLGIILSFKKLEVTCMGDVWTRKELP